MALLLRLARAQQGRGSGNLRALPLSSSRGPAFLSVLITLPAASVQTLWERPASEPRHHFLFLEIHSHTIKITLMKWTCSSVVSSVFTESCNHQHCLLPEHLITHQRNLFPTSSHSSSPSPRPLQLEIYILHEFACSGHFI